MKEKTYEVHTSADEVLIIKTSLDIEIWIEEYEEAERELCHRTGCPEETAPTVTEYDIVEEPDEVETEEWWAA